MKKIFVTLLFLSGLLVVLTGCEKKEPKFALDDASLKLEDDAFACHKTLSGPHDKETEDRCKKIEEAYEKRFPVRL